MENVNKVQEKTYETSLIKGIEYQGADKVGKLKEILNKYPDDMGIGFINQPFQNLFYIKFKEYESPGFLAFQETASNELNWREKYEKCINVIKRFDAGIIGMYDL